jgi:hypothetical protein
MPVNESLNPFEGAPIDITKEEQKKVWNVLELEPFEARYYYRKVETQNPNPKCGLCMCEFSHSELVISFFLFKQDGTHSTLSRIQNKMSTTSDGSWRVSNEEIQIFHSKSR